MEKWDLYNAKREKSGITVCRGEIIPKGLYHLSVSVWIVNQQGQYLLSQRHPKKQYPLYWECTGGSVLSGETSLQGAIREVKEELGIQKLWNMRTSITPWHPPRIRLPYSADGAHSSTTLTARCRSSFPLSTAVPIPAAAIKSISRKRMTTITASGTSLPGC